MHYTFQHSPLMQYWDRVDKREERESKRVLLHTDTIGDENFLHQHEVRKILVETHYYTILANGLQYNH